MRARLTIAVAQPLTISHDVIGNAGRHADAIRRARSRVVVFPELSITGYEFDADPIDATDPRLRPIVAACRARGTIALVGAPHKNRDGSAAIGVLSIQASGVELAYRKMWLGEHETPVFAAGDRPRVIDVDGWRIGLAACKDTGVPEHARITAARGLDAYVAGVLEHDRDREVQPARALQVCANHGVWVAIASFAGATGQGFDHTAGRSAIWRPDGSIAAHAGASPGELVSAQLDPPIGSF